MNETTIHGNLTANPIVHIKPNTGRTATTFDVAVNSRWYDRARGHYIDRSPVYHRVVCFGELAGNAADTLNKGMTVTVTGSFADDSYTPTGADRPIRRIRLEATDIAVSLRWAIADVTRRTGPAEQPQNAAPASAAEPTPQPESGSDAAAQTPANAAGGPDGQPAAKQDPATPRPATKRGQRSRPAAAA